MEHLLVHYQGHHQRRRRLLRSPYAGVQERVNKTMQGCNRDTSEGSGHDGRLTTLPLDCALSGCYIQSDNGSYQMSLAEPRGHSSLI